MGVTLGVVVHDDDHADFVRACAGVDGPVPDGVRLVWVRYRTETEIRTRVAGLLGGRGVDGLLLGPVPHDHCHDLLTGGTPVGVVRPGAFELALALVMAPRRGTAMAATPGGGVLSVDTVDTGAVAEVVAALGLHPDAVVVQPWAPGQDPHRIAAAHLRAVARGGVVISGRRTTVRLLRGRAPVVACQAGDSTVRAALAGLALRAGPSAGPAGGTPGSDDAGGGVVGGVVGGAVDGGPDRHAAAVVLTLTPTADGAPSARDRLAALLARTPEYADAWVTAHGPHALLVLAHHGLCAAATDGWTAFGLAARVRAALGAGLHAGFGTGGSVRACVTLAERALARARADRPDCAYVVSETGVVLGPLGAAGTARRTASPVVADHDLCRLARDVGLSTLTVSRLVAVERTLRGRAISPTALAAQLGITDPSGRRLLRKLDGHGLVSAQGSTRIHRRGRPTRLYRLQIDPAARAAADG